MINHVSLLGHGVMMLTEFMVITTTKTVSGEAVVLKIE